MNADGFSCDTHLTEVPNGWIGIYNVNDLQNMQINNASAKYIVMNNIDASITTTWNWDSGREVYAGFIPVGHTSTANSFAGSFDGNCYVISNLYINSTGRAGLFGFAQAEIKNVKLENLNITSSHSAGGLGHLHTGSIINSYATGSVIGNWGAGCLAIRSSYISNSYAACNVVYSTHSESCAGGLSCEVDGTISNSYSTSNVTGSQMVGGLVGLCSDISNSYATGDVTGFSQVGGLVGTSYWKISNSYATGRVTGKYYVGGLVGYIADDADEEPIIINSYATGDVIGTSLSEGVGGLAGEARGSNISNSYATGEVGGSTKVGGLVGSSSYNTITNSYYDKDTTGRSDTGKGEPKTTAEMKTQSTYVGWDFFNVWGINIENNSGYPFLRRQRGAELVGEYVTEIELSEGWNLFSISRNYTNENATRNITLKQGFNFVGYSGNGSLNFSKVEINGNAWYDAVGRGIVSSYILGFGNGFYAPFIPSSISKNQGYIIYSFSDNVNMTIKDTFGNGEIEYMLRNIRVLNRTSGNIYFFEEKREWFYPIAGVGVYEYNGTVDGSETYNELYLEDELKSWESYWIRAKYENLSLIFYG